LVNASLESLVARFTSGAELSTKPLRDIPATALGEDAYVPEEESQSESARRFRRARVLKPQLVAEHARSLGINPAYELRNVAAPNGNDRTVQTLLFRDALERKLSGAYDENRRYQQELGVNALFGCFGFLEWYEAGQSNRARFAPLLLLPTEINRKVHAGQYEYRIAGAGDEFQTNISLKERLRADFAIELPDLDDEETPQGYLSRVESLAKRHDRWNVHGFVTIAILNFSKIAMYNDLDPEASGFDEAIERHPIVANILGGSDEPFDDSDPHDVTQPDELSADEAPLLLTDADFSQYAAVVRALDERSLVIEGPPGTGKSQTITNIIGAALAEGQTVLFLAEKLAALQIVKDKLDHFGLGDFVLELHSTKSRKTDVLASVNKRLDFKHIAKPDVEPTLRDLKAERAAINDYLDALHADVGALRRSLHDVIWREIEIRRKRGLSTVLTTREQVS